MNTFKHKVKKKKNKISMYTIGNFSLSSTHFNHGVILRTEIQLVLYFLVFNTTVFYYCFFGTTSFMSSQSFSQLIPVNLQYNGIKITNQCSDVNCVKSICIGGLPGSYYAQGKSSKHGQFPHSGQVLCFISLNLFLYLHLER